MSESSPGIRTSHHLHPHRPRSACWTRSTCRRDHLKVVVWMWVAELPVSRSFAAGRRATGRNTCPQCHDKSGPSRPSGPMPATKLHCCHPSVGGSVEQLARWIIHTYSQTKYLFTNWGAFLPNEDVDLFPLPEIHCGFCDRPVRRHLINQRPTTTSSPFRNQSEIRIYS